MAQSEKLDQDGVDAQKPKYMRPSECRRHMRKTLAREFENIVDGFVKAAKKGSCQHVKLATELLKSERKVISRKKGSATRYWEELQKEEGERDRLRKERAAAD